MNEARAGQLSREEVLALRGIRLPALALKRLRRTGIYCDPAVSIQHQTSARRYVIRGVESGGAVQEMGAYCSFVNTDGNPLPWLQKIESVGRNGLHAVVVAPELLRLQMFRNEQTYQLLITRHRLDRVEEARRPVLVNTIVFHGINGTLGTAGVSLESKTQSLLFRTRSGEVLHVPGELLWAVKDIVAGSTCLGCKHCHLLRDEQAAVEYAEVLPI